MGIIGDIIRGKGKLITIKPKWWQGLEARVDLRRLGRDCKFLLKTGRSSLDALNKNNKKLLDKNMEKFEKRLEKAAEEYKEVQLVLLRYQQALLEAEDVYVKCEQALKGKRGVSKSFIEKHDSNFDKGIGKLEKVNELTSQMSARMQREQEMRRKAA